MHRTSFTAHKNHLIIWANKRAYCILIDGPGKRYDGLWLLIENTDLYFLLHNFGVQLSFLDWGILSGLSGSYESLDKEDCSPFIVAKFALSLKSSFSSCMDKKAFETLTE